MSLNDDNLIIPRKEIAGIRLGKMFIRPGTTRLQLEHQFRSPYLNSDEIQVQNPYTNTPKGTLFSSFNPIFRREHRQVSRWLLLLLKTFLVKKMRALKGSNTDNALQFLL